MSTAEFDRIQTLHRLAVLDTAPEPVFDAITAAAARICGVPIALISLIDTDRQWFKSNVGLPGVEETPRDAAFCDHAIRDAELFEVPDATADQRFAANPLVVGNPGIRFYAGAPIVMDDGSRIGTVCVIDRRPGQLNPTQRAMLETLADIVSAALVERTRFLAVASELAASEARFKRLYESTPVAMHSIDADGRLLNVSDLWLQTLGYERSEVIGRPSMDFLTAESAERARDVVLPEFFRTGRCDRVEYQFVCKSGSVLDMLLSAILERDPQGKPLRSLAALENVTQSKQLASELNRTNADLDAILDNVPAMIGHWNQDGVTRFANREYQAAIGLPLERIVGHELREIFDAVDPAAYPAVAPRVAAVLGGSRQEFELAMLTTAGLRQLRMTFVPDQSQPDRVTGFYGMANDITGRKALELRLTDSEQRYRSLFDNLNSGFSLNEIIVDADGKPVDYRFLAMNAAFSAMTGLEPAAAIGRRVSEALPGIESEAGNWVGVFGAVALTGVPTHFEQHSLALHRWFEVVAYRPAPGQFAVIAQDITHRKEAEAKLQEAVLEKETLLKEVYHRVKNNLQVVQSLLSLQRRSVPEGPASTALEESVQRVRAMALVHEKLYQSGNLAAVSVVDYTADLLKQISDATGAAQRRISLRADIAPILTGLDGAIPFGLLVSELISNALKHGFNDGRGGEVRIVLTQQEGGVMLSVSDDGVGLPDSFDLASPGTMGLQLAVNLSRQLGGELQVDRGRGAGFKVLLTRL